MVSPTEQIRESLIWVMDVRMTPFTVKTTDPFPEILGCAELVPKGKSHSNIPLNLRMRQLCGLEGSSCLWTNSKKFKSGSIVGRVNKP